MDVLQNMLTVQILWFWFFKLTMIILNEIIHTTGSVCSLFFNILRILNNDEDIDTFKSLCNNLKLLYVSIVKLHSQSLNPKNVFIQIPPPPHCRLHFNGRCDVYSIFSVCYRYKAVYQKVLYFILFQRIAFKMYWKKSFFCDATDFLCILM